MASLSSNTLTSSITAQTTSIPAAPSAALSPPSAASSRVPPSTTLAAAPNTSTDASSPITPPGELSGGEKVGIGLGVTFAVLIVAGIVLFFIRQRKQQIRSGSSGSSDKTFGARDYDIERDETIITALHAKELGVRNARPALRSQSRRPSIGSPTNFRRPGTAGTLGGMTEVMSGYGSGHSTPYHSRSMADLRSYAHTPARSRQNSVYSDHQGGLRSHPVTPTHNRSMAAELEKLPTLPLQIFGPNVQKAIPRKAVTPPQSAPTSAPRTPVSTPRTPIEFTTPAEFPPIPRMDSNAPVLPPVNTIHRRRGSEGPRLSLIGTMPSTAMHVPPTPSTPAGHLGGVNSGETPPGDSPTLGLQGEPTFIASIPPGASFWAHTQRVLAEQGGGFTPLGTPVAMPMTPGFSNATPRHPTIAEVVESDESPVAEGNEDAQLEQLKDKQYRILAKKSRLLELHRLEAEEEELGRQIEQVEQLKKQRSQVSLHTLHTLQTPPVKGLGLSAPGGILPSPVSTPTP